MSVSEVIRPHMDTPCWEYQGFLTEKGYGRLVFEKQRYYAHRLSYILSKGPMGDLLVLHNCDNPRCCNPDHLRLGTHQDNMDDVVTRGTGKGRNKGIVRSAETRRKMSEAKRGLTNKP